MQLSVKAEAAQHAAGEQAQYTRQLPLPLPLPMSPHTAAAVAVQWGSSAHVQAVEEALLQLATEVVTGPGR